ncbi:acetyltransferase [Alkalilimnicola ehrlichii]|uniref:Acetyltransferase n=1 Tax=Alkalilimnicola ehrlichii TaxID=351052 RepID=A0A3E0WT47_9GAMM|nr:arylamine N-acetyltransferase [Alkalilimnicola ehrlichii]RFA29231.1 acetyltransferase [Alkalilimnicola ehrlichii]RFA36144.1 acetyltransferase [Alkalilimnicola ehrlichii]
MIASTTSNLHPTARWETEGLDLDAYLARIGYDGPLAADVASLRALQRAHLAAIPFENLDVISGGEIRLDIASLQDKLVRRRRGGYCHEQNILFATVLDRLGFTVEGRSARILMGNDERELTAMSHTILAVQAESRDWHIDVGVGNEGPREPIPLADGIEARHDRWIYRLDRAVSGHWVLRHRRGDDWFNLYQFSEERYYRADYADHNYVVSHHPDSPFTRQIIVQRNGADTRYALTDRTLKVFRPGKEPEEREIEAEAVIELLRETFALHLAIDQEKRLLERLQAIPPS